MTMRIQKKTFSLFALIAMACLAGVSTYVVAQDERDRPPADNDRRAGRSEPRPDRPERDRNPDDRFERHRPERPDRHPGDDHPDAHHPGDDPRQQGHRGGPAGPERHLDHRLAQLRRQHSVLQRRAQEVDQQLEAGEVDSEQVERILTAINQRAEEIRREVKSIERQKQSGHQGFDEGLNQDVPEDLRRRIHHLRAAVENLDAAGMHEEADELAG
ncbi:MAG: hypothetical protein N2C12_08565, partial [Planctomycetales bacterium]